MKFDAANIDIINSNMVSIHDDVFKSLEFDKSKHKLLVSAFHNNSEYSIEFQNVVGFEISACNYWGESPHILDIEYVLPQEQILIPRLYNNIDSNDVFPLHKLTPSINYVEMLMTFTSGDALRIVCECIFINQ